VAAAAASAAAAFAVKGDENHAFAVGAGDFVLHGVKFVEACTVKLRKFFVAHKNTSSKIVFPEHSEKTKSKISDVSQKMPSGSTLSKKVRKK